MKYRSRVVRTHLQILVYLNEHFSMIFVYFTLCIICIILYNLQCLFYFINYFVAVIYLDDVSELLILHFIAFDLLYTI